MLNTKFLLSSLVSGLIPFVCKNMTVMPQVGYIVLSALFLALSFVSAFFVYRNQRKIPDKKTLNSYRWSVYSLISSLASLVCVFLYPAISLNSIEENIFSLQLPNLVQLESDADKGDVSAMISLGDYFSNSRVGGINENDISILDYPEAGKYYEMAADSGSVFAYLRLAEMAYFGLGRRHSRERAIDEIKRAYHINSDAHDKVLFVLNEIDISEEEFPEGYHELCSFLIEQNRIKDFEKSETHAALLRVKAILDEYNRLRVIPIDSSAIVGYCRQAIPLLEDLSQRLPELLPKIAVMCLYTGEHDKGLEYSSVDTDKSPAYKMFFSENQQYSEYQTDIDSILVSTDLPTLKQVYLENVFLGLDDFYNLALRLELLKRGLGDRAEIVDNFDAIRRDMQLLFSKYERNETHYDNNLPLPYITVAVRPSFKSGSYISDFGWGIEPGRLESYDGNLHEYVDLLLSKIKSK